MTPAAFTCNPNQQRLKTAMSSTKTSVSLLAILGALMAMTSIAIDIYLPAMPVMEEKTWW